MGRDPKTTPITLLRQIRELADSARREPLPDTQRRVWQVTAVDEESQTCDLKAVYDPAETLSVLIALEDVSYLGLPAIGDNGTIARLGDGKVVFLGAGTGTEITVVTAVRWDSASGKFQAKTRTAYVISPGTESEWTDVFDTGPCFTTTTTTQAP